MLNVLRLMLTVMLLLVTPFSAFSTDNPPEHPQAPRNVPGMPSTTEATPIEKISNGIYRLGEITINKQERSISFPGQVNMESGLLEYLIVSNYGKTHESLIRTRVEPYHLQIAMLLLGIEGNNNPLSPGQGGQEKPTGDPLEVTLTMEQKTGGKVSVRPEDWLTIKREDGSVAKKERIEWVFTGSFVDDGRFFAQMTGSIAALYHDSAALIDNTSKEGESDEMWFVNEKTVPPAGTNVIITIKGGKQTKGASK